MFLRISGTDEKNKDVTRYINDRYIVAVMDEGRGTIIFRTIDGGRLEVHTEQTLEDIVKLISTNERR